LPDAVDVIDQEHLVDVELASLAFPLCAVDRGGVRVVTQRPFQGGQIRAAGETTRLAEQREDLLAAFVHVRDRHGAVDDPDGVLGDHLEQRTRVAAAECVEDATDPVVSVQAVRA
jgi:hypothetical protein